MKSKYEFGSNRFPNSTVNSRDFSKTSHNFSLTLNNVHALRNDLVKKGNPFSDSNKREVNQLHSKIKALKKNVDQEALIQCKQHLDD